MAKIGRNDSCPCGSGQKYKKCCLDKDKMKANMPPKEFSIPPEAFVELEKRKAQIQQAQKQQGLGRDIVSTEFQGYRFVAVGSRLYYDKDWKTFHDFLLDFVPNIMGREWLQNQFKKPREHWHPLANWRKLTIDNLNAQKTGPGITTGSMTGATFAYMHLSYNLYLLAHHNYLRTGNDKLTERMIKRLRDPKGFEDVFYETTVAAIFIRAGFQLEPENEEDGQTTHCEFTAISKTGEKFSVEAKARRPHKENVGIGNQLYKALKKKAQHKRIIFIDVNIPDMLAKKDEIFGELNRQESKLTIDGKPSDQAYVFVTNHSYSYDLEGLQHERTGFAHGFKMTDFRLDSKFSNLREALRSRDSHKSMFGLMTSMNEHREIPSTFDGEIPEFAFDEVAQKNRLVVGNKYVVPTPNGEKEGILETATVMSKNWEIYGVFRLNDGQRIICANPMTSKEIQAYQKHPDTFFGVPISTGKQVKDVLEMFDFLYETYRKSSRETLLGFLKNSPDYEQLKLSSDKELAVIVCERWASSMMRDSKSV